MNLYTVLTGMPILEDVSISMYRFFDDDPILFKWFKQDQFVTGYYEDYKVGSIFNWLKRGFHYRPTDHYFRPFSIAIEEGPAAQWARDFCYLDEGQHVWVGNWTRSFVNQYSALEQPTFLWAWTTLIAHEAGNLLGKGDEYYYKLFREMHESHVLNNTVLIFFSDHGYRYGGLRATKIGQHEENHPIMHWIMPSWFQKKYSKEMEIFKTNAHNRLTTPYDIHRTVLEFANGAVDSAKRAGMSENGQSLFEPISNRRTCAGAGIPDHFCGCREAQELPVTDRLSKVAALAIVYRVNNITEIERKKCVVYKLHHIIKSLHNIRSDLADGNIAELSVTVRVTPSRAEFSATVHVYLDDSQPASVRGISRVSLYGNSANCVEDFRMRLYCTCAKYIG